LYVLPFLKSLTGQKLYIGSTNDLRRRLSEHNIRNVESTEFRKPIELRYYEAFFNENDVRKREFSLKKDAEALGQLNKENI
jgi:predicted GIY-YIG superfamily endonuclease